MVRILFGGPQEEVRGKPSQIHSGLIDRLKALNHEVVYVTRGDEFMGSLSTNYDGLNEMRARFRLDQEKYKLIIYDTRLIGDWGSGEKPQRAGLFKKMVIAPLTEVQVPVIILADPLRTELIRELVEQAGFKQIDQPYCIEDVINEVNFYLNSK